MPSIQYLNQTAPFWDFIANMEEQGSQHPFFNAQRGRHEGGQQHPFAWGFGGPRAFHHGPPPPPGPGNADYIPPPPPPPPPRGAEGIPPPPDAPQHGPLPHHPHPHPHSHPRGGCHGRRGHGFGGRGGRGGPFGGFPMGGLGAWLNSLADDENTNGNTREATAQEDFEPEADVFDTEASFVVHVSLAGAKKEDVGVSWDAEKSELSIAGVIHRPGDEDFVKTLALNERRVGAFERKVRLGSRANPAPVDADMITAKLEDGILRVDVPKLDKDYVEIKKVDIA
ncbi:hypothetical protein EJ05DRAFT_477175 [Pseudovirgaria hyperparasitica]|uniref:SHSP domain-containing protein n=1 Tax=Pseudovirgaria hyperparasitica TaxID=470096 RepID=A0A6A6W463_9PEZI|nr:uncharacterized protein EJ05DRAFT_477175 [Pseudovirgaria hyperparasitica]KAF2756959.1 hypothetical protein EJ05DRAFT_477175 [Pseudovirgaria hyperparasitica]